jgi:antitoxin ParD1/3/4
MNISLPEEMRAFIEAQLAEEGYATASECFHDLIREEQRRKAKCDLEAKVAEGLQGTPIPMTGKEWQAMEREARDGLAGENLRRAKRGQEPS